MNIKHTIEKWFVGRGRIIGFVKRRPISTSRVVRASKVANGVVVETESAGNRYLLRHPLDHADEKHLLKEFGEASK